MGGRKGEMMENVGGFLKKIKNNILLDLGAVLPGDLGKNGCKMTASV